MPRRTAAERHTDSAPPEEIPALPEGAALIDALLALHHPVRRRIFEILTNDGPATVGQLASRLGIAVGSVSHHLKPMHKAGFIEPAPELAKDTRESWWRGRQRRLSWSREDYADGSFARQVTDTAEHANLEYLNAATVRWMRTRDELPAQWQESLATDSFVPATVDQLKDLMQRLDALTEEWSREVRADAGLHPDAERRPVRLIARVFPSEPGAV
ncbi:transcriptional regulator [Flexivirga endophytica]|uniref:Transcriptional regulator n=1 Tax=Flexivirga endophytica TaxID=1849103 RepID=A0A916T275_9MICO|nr:helix-turn-helix domain-containing protein [Flexivirga endophytica]GGB27623.1 transcriptional regulator [Flexivirga endophytica]GHB61476.1 transcriptional regulator [Flexivirga endophytica]